MNFAENIGFEPYRFQYEVDTYLYVKDKKEIQDINRRLKEESPESDYQSYAWYMTDEKIEKLKDKRVRVGSQIAWHGGLPYYVVKTREGQGYDVAEFYCQESLRHEPDSEG